VNRPLQGERRLARRTRPFPELGILPVTGGRAYDARGLVEQAAKSQAGIQLAGTNELLARALAILHEEVEAWQARGVAGITPGEPP
jgi:hypothetical protein